MCSATQPLSHSATGNKRIQILLPVAVDAPFDYLAPDGMKARAGNYVRTLFRGKPTIGVVWSEEASGKEIPPGKLKAVQEILPIPPMPENLRKFIEWVANYNMVPLGAVLGMAIGGADQMPDIRKQISEKEVLTSDIWHLTSGQSEAFNKLLPHIRTDNFNVTLLDGVTGSGKTEVYFAAIRKNLAEHPGHQILIMLPEIALTQSLIGRVESRLGISPTLWHSNLTPKRRRENWLSIATGEAKLIIGARSALFLPYKNLSLIVVDEEHDASYKQEEGVVYNARDMAVVRGSIEKIPVILVSATPSLETVVNAGNGKYSEINLPVRFGGAKMPEIEIIDLRQEKREKNSWISAPLRAEMAANLARGEQSLLYLNRRGYAPLTLCRACGHHLKCRYCSAYLVVHRMTDYGLRMARKKEEPTLSSVIRHPSSCLQCHHCGHTSKMPENCPECGEKESLIALGPGIERLEEEIRDFLPQARILSLSSDTVESVKKLKKSLDDIENRSIDVVLGTQMVAKGHHFPGLTLVGIIDADSGLIGGDFRGSERTFQVLQQVSGRAGREKLPGKVMIQTFLPESRVIKTLASGSRKEFLDMEMRIREDNGLPPFGRLAALIISGKKEETVRKYCGLLAKAAPIVKGLTALGPAPAPLTLLRGKFRHRFLLKGGKTVNLQKIIREWLDSCPPPAAIRVKADIDPYSFV